VPDHLRHLVWVGCSKVADAIAATDILIRDCNYGVVTLDVREANPRELARIPSTTWHRMRLAVEDAQAALVVLTTSPVVPSVAWRLELMGKMTLGRTPLAALKTTIEVRCVRERERETNWRVSA